MADNSNTSEPKTVRELARELHIAQDAYSKAYWANSASLPVEERIDAQIASDAAFKVVCAARAALSAAQQTQSVAA